MVYGYVSGAFGFTYPVPVNAIRGVCRWYSCVGSLKLYEKWTQTRMGKVLGKGPRYGERLLGVDGLS